MHFNSALKPRLLLWPFSLLYGLAVYIRNLLYDWHILPSVRFPFPIICVGNLSAGGTGKTPMVEYLIEFLQPHFSVATLSRGYGRKTKGYLLAGPTITAEMLGDEPMQFHRKFPRITVAVGEKRAEVIPRILKDQPGTNLLILDDAFQHRAVKAGLNIVLTDYAHLYTKDFLLPAGNLREPVSGAKRADIIIVSKCPPSLSVAEKEKIKKELKPCKQQQVYFSAIEYGIPYHSLTSEKRELKPTDHPIILTGIANPKPLFHYIQSKFITFKERQFSDHHNFSTKDITDIIEYYNNFAEKNKYLLTTEKDITRLESFKSQLGQQLPLYIIPIKTKILFEEDTALKKRITAFINNYKN